MRIFESLNEAASEISRDVYKGTRVQSSRVQQRIGLELEGRELFGYSYSIQDTLHPSDINDLIQIGQLMEFPLYDTDEKRDQMYKWLSEEILYRTHPPYALTGIVKNHLFTESLHPALISTFEGSAPSYSYNERLTNAIDFIVEELMAHPDSRRAFWPIYTPHDAYRMSYPTRIPCSLGYQFMIRRVGNERRLIMIYLERSCDFDHFWLSDVFLAFRFQHKIVARINIELGLQGKPPIIPGAFIHFISSFHSFRVELEEIY